MTPVAKALWFIERHINEDVTLADIAEIAGVSRFHMVHAFNATTGCTVMRYVRARRLTEAAHTLANGAPDILMVALDAGYGSHEAFTRAFRDQFGLTPDQVRSAGTTDNLSLQDPLTMAEPMKMTVQPPRFENGKTLLIAGLGDHVRFDTLAALPALWQRFRPSLAAAPNQPRPVAYGVCYNTDDTGFDYISGIEVPSFDNLPSDYAKLRVAPQRYAVFTHTDQISSIQGTFMAIFNDWFPQSGHRPAEAPVFERYDHRFDPHTGTGGLEIWVPLAT